jgi:hypothetical protein
MIHRKFYFEKGKRRAGLKTLIKYDGGSAAIGNTEPER